LPDPFALAIAPETLTMPDRNTPGGRGIVLIQHCMEEVRYNEAEHCLEMKMRRKPFCKGDVSHE
jgi:anti-sigma regulatory factor (Ser/Thr protein kinase)